MRPFVQIDNSLNRKYPGTGLGLPIVKGLMELHGGTFELTSEVGVGTTAVVNFPSEPNHG
jgi:signal transduction histidine kinase